MGDKNRDGAMMNLQYVKRYQMVFNLQTRPLPVAVLPVGYLWIEWHPRFVDDHARVLYLGFRGEMDSLIFPSFRRFDSCLRLMRQVCGGVNFLPRTCWLIANEVGLEREYCASIQGIRESSHVGGIQNVVVLNHHRHRGLAEALLLKSLAGFRDSGCLQVSLDVTAENVPALELYRKIGFDLLRTTYKETWLE